MGLAVTSGRRRGERRGSVASRGAGLAAALAAVAAVAAGCGGPADTPAGPTATNATTASRAPSGGGCPPAPPVAPATTTTPSGGEEPELLRVEVVARHPHDPGAFTQGLAYGGADQLLESTGRAPSSARRVELSTGRVLVDQQLPVPLFGEGMAPAGDDVVQLTWQDGVGIVRARCDLAELRRFPLEGEGWGLAAAGGVLWRSDGSSLLRVHDAVTFAVISEVPVTDRGTPVERLNELEVVDGAVLANVWETPYVARISPGDGRVTGWVDASALVDEVGSDDRAAVLNGIAHDPATGRLWMTGKLWPTVFEVRVVPDDGALPPPGGPG